MLDPYSKKMGQATGIRRIDEAGNGHLKGDPCVLLGPPHACKYL